MGQRCIVCNAVPYNNRSNLCSKCFSKILSEKIKEDDNETKRDESEKSRYSWF